MEFHEKLQKLRKARGLTQEELAEALFVSRTAISKWESGRGYPNIDSLKEIASFFSVTVDELLSGEKILSIAEKENKSNIRNLCDVFWGIVDVFSFILIILPLYPNMVNGYIYSVNLFAYTETSALNQWSYWILFIALIVSGGVKLVLMKLEFEKSNKTITGISLLLSILSVLLLAMTREAYALTVVFLMLVIKVLLFIKYIKAGG